MMSEFRVMDWLREVRDRNAEEESGLSLTERLARTERGAHELLEQMLEAAEVTVHRGGQWRVKRAASEQE